MEHSPFIMVAAFVIILAGMFFAKSIINPFLLALFIGVICMQPISWLERKKTPPWLARFIVIMGLGYFFRIYLPDGIQKFSC